MHELPLLIFTLCLQGSVGVTLWLALGRQYAVEGRVPARGALPAMAGAFVLACVGLLASALHMGYPLNALNALRHVASSWLSREIVFASLYLAALGLGGVLLFFRKPGWQPLLALAAAFGLVDVFCMAQVYIHASVATWQHSNTLALFFGTSGIIGSVVIALAYLRNAGAARRCAVVVVALMVLIRPCSRYGWRILMRWIRRSSLSRIIRYRRWRSCVTSIFSAGVSQRRECSALPQAVCETPEGRWWRAAYCCFSARLCCATSSLVLADG